MTATTPPSLPVVFSFGMGIDSAAVLTRLITDPASRDYPLTALTVLTAQVGNELDITRRLMEAHVLPLMRTHRVRYVQICRAAQAGGYVVLDDTTVPQRMIMRGPWALSDELTRSGTIPQLGGARKCSHRAKASVLDAWLADEHRGRPFRHILGFASDETRRADRDQGYATGCRLPEYPLITWGWDRSACAAYLLDIFGEPWARSACSFCPFSASREGLPDLLARWRAEPQAAADALVLEHTALALNSNALLFGTRSARHIAETHQLTDALAAYRDRLTRATWALYDVRRIIHPRHGDPTAKGTAWRAVRTLATGPRTAMLAALDQRARRARLPVTTDEHGIPRVTVIPRCGTYPAMEHSWAIAPEGVDDKKRASFDDHWDRLTRAHLAAA